MEKHERTAAQLAASATFQQPSELNEQSPIVTPTTGQMDKLWTRLAGLYGNSFTKQFGETPSDAWRAALLGFTGEDLARGLRACVKSGDTFPPNAVAFAKLCKEFQTAAHRPFAQTENLIESDASKQHRADTAQHWHHMWVLAGLSQLDALTPDERKKFITDFGPGPHEKWTDAKIQDYCKRATQAIEQGRALPTLEILR